VDGVLDALRDGVVWVVTASITAVATWAGWVTRSVMTHKTRIAVLEETVRQVPIHTGEIKQTLREMRAENLDARDESALAREKIYTKIDDVRLELKADIKDARL